MVSPDIPITMLCFLWQLTRGIVYSKFVNFLLHNPLLFCYQYHYHLMRSCFLHQNQFYFYRHGHILLDQNVHLAHIHCHMWQFCLCHCHIGHYYATGLQVSQQHFFYRIQSCFIRIHTVHRQASTTFEWLRLYWTEEWQWNHELQLQKWELPTCDCKIWAQ